MKSFLVLFCLCGTLQAGQNGITDLFLPPWYSEAITQVFSLELKDLADNEIVLDHPCSVSVSERLIRVTNGVARATLTIDLQATPTSFPLVVLGVHADGQRTEFRKLICHLSLVSTPVKIEVRGVNFILSNLTDRAFEIEGYDGLTISSHDNRQVRGTLKGKAWIRFKAHGTIQLDRDESEELP